MKGRWESSWKNQKRSRFFFKKMFWCVEKYVGKSLRENNGLTLYFFKWHGDYPLPEVTSQSTTITLPYFICKYAWRNGKPNYNILLIKLNVRTVHSLLTNRHLKTLIKELCRTAWKMLTVSFCDICDLVLSVKYGGQILYFARSC